MQYIMIGGLMRSGTTLIANFLNSQQNITVFRDFLVSLRLFDEHELMNMNDNAKDILLTQIKEEMMTTAHLDVQFERNKIKNICDIFAHSLDEIALSKDLFVGTKLTESMDIFQILSNCESNNIKFIYVVRDIRDVILSGKNMFKNYNPISAIYQWKKEIIEIDKLKEKLSNNLIIIRYEDFILQEEREQLESFLKVKLEWNLTRFKDRDSEIWRNNSSFKNMDKQDGISTKSLYRWKNEISNNKFLQLANELCSNEIAQLNYEKSSAVRLNIFTKYKFIFVYKIKYYILSVGKKAYNFLNK